MGKMILSFRGEQRTQVTFRALSKPFQSAEEKMHPLQSQSIAACSWCWSETR
ncbi:uncharacterized protein STEHIDRAFT_117746 [Stereum hirsutum FP-91666 SS1]|uniref:uncharacterized protein n=1 Tax=Stereum hirsutum (strain FP-91666) TaxID=721885 RepID=UPI000440D5BD|nr:uncharacterized protein STEHIDRAFT_117746 [Stereum hirsutum FP-91666 SS1]EIM92781.1 hypothetical protein STEHIDRAFT_117746 [Stereum hirsutum FP-91666 SS1]